jgi:hypothetical protein
VRGSAGAHRSRAIVADERRLVRVSLYAPAAAPDLVLVEFRCGGQLLLARQAYCLGRVLQSYARIAEGGSR